MDDGIACAERFAVNHFLLNAELGRPHRSVSLRLQSSRRTVKDRSVDRGLSISCSLQCAAAGKKLCSL
jgi:hypothetical protein